jgi:hypothetical protein
VRVDLHVHVDIDGVKLAGVQRSFSSFAAGPGASAGAAAGSRRRGLRPRALRPPPGGVLHRCNLQSLKISTIA